MTDVTNELIYKVSKSLQQGQADLKAGQQELKAELQAIRGDMVAFQTDINNRIWISGLNGSRDG